MISSLYNETDCKQAVINMSLLDFTCVVVLTAVVVVDAAFHGLKPKVLRLEPKCYNVTEEPYFEKALVAGRTWRTYFVWDMNFDEMCVDVMFKHVKPVMIHRLRMESYRMQIQPPWTRPALLMTMGPHRGLILFYDYSNIPGRFIGVPEVIREDFTERLELRTYKMTMKLLQRGRYLIIGDCTAGVTSLLIRRENRPPRADINALAATLKFGDPFPACTREPDPEIITTVDPIDDDIDEEPISFYSY